MKKFQYAIAIVAGLAAGTLVLVISGDKASAFGTMLLSSVLTTLVISLSKARLGVAIQFTGKCTTVLKQKMSIDHPAINDWHELIDMEPNWFRRNWLQLMPVWKPMLWTAHWLRVGIAIAIFRVAWVAYYCLLLPSYRMPAWIFQCERYRKEFYYILVLLVLGIVAFYSVFGPLVLMNELSHPGIFGMLFGILLVILAMVSGLSVILAVIVLLGEFFTIGFQKSPEASLTKEKLLRKSDILFYWFDCGSLDNRPPFQSIRYMLKIRLLNVLIICAWPFVLVILVVGALLFAILNKKAGMSAIVTAVLLGIEYLSAVYLGWFTVGSLNFWLMCGVLSFMGFAIGRKIHDLDIKSILGYVSDLALGFTDILEQNEHDPVRVNS